jgi:hypothetical protein
MWDQFDKTFEEANKTWKMADKLPRTNSSSSDGAFSFTRLAGWELRLEAFRRRHRPSLFAWRDMLSCWKTAPPKRVVHCFWSEADAMEAIASGRLPAGTYWDLKK